MGTFQIRFSKFKSLQKLVLYKLNYNKIIIQIFRFQYIIFSQKLVLIQSQKMFLNKNNKGKQLTLEQIIQKSSVRRAIQSIKLSQIAVTQYNKHSNLISNKNVHLEYPNQDSNINKAKSTEITKQYLSIKQAKKSSLQKQRNKSNSARINSSLKQKGKQKDVKQCNLQLNGKRSTDFHSKQFVLSTELHSQKNYNNNINFQPIKKMPLKNQRAKSLKCNALSINNQNERPQLFKERIKSFGTIVTNKNSLQIPQYQIKKNKKVIQFQSQKFFNSIQPQVSTLEFTPQNKHDLKKFHSFMLTKYSASNLSSQKNKGMNSLSNKNKSHSHSKFPSKNNNVIENYTYKAKDIKNRIIKTQQKSRNAQTHTQIKDEQSELKTIFKGQSKNIKSARLKKYEIVLDIENEQEIKCKQQKQGKQNNNNFVSNIQEEKPQEQITKNKNRGFKGNKLKNNQAITTLTKTKFFIPDFIKPSLDLKIIEQQQQKRKCKVLQNQNSAQSRNRIQLQMENEKGQTDNKQQIDEYFDLRQFLETQKCQIQRKDPLSKISINAQNQQEELDELNMKNKLKKIKANLIPGANMDKQAKRLRKFKKLEDADLCGWQEGKKSKLFQGIQIDQSF